MLERENTYLRRVDEESALLEQADPHYATWWELVTIEWRLVLYKIQYFFLMGAESVDRTFFRLFLKQVGKSPTQIGIITGAAPFAVCISNAIVGTLANKCRISKTVLLAASFATAIIAAGSAILQMPGQTSECTSEMLALANGSSKSPNSHQLYLGWLYKVSDVHKFFNMLVITHTAFYLVRSLTMTFTDVALVSALGEKGMSRYSNQRSFGSLGSILFGIGIGPIVAGTVYKRIICDIELTFSDYQVPYYIVGAAMFICFLGSSTFEFENDKDQQMYLDTIELVPRVTLVASPIPSEAGRISSMCIQREEENNAVKPKFSIRRIVGVFWSVDYGSWLLCVFYTSFCLAVTSYSYLYLELLGGDGFLVGVVGDVCAGSNFIFYVFAFWIVQRLGTINSLYFTLVGYTVRFTLLAIIENPWLGLLQAMLSGCTASVGWVAILQYVAEEFTKEEVTSIIGIIHGVYYGLGAGFGQLITGAVLDLIGGRYTFAIMAGTTLLFIRLFQLAQQASQDPSYRPVRDMDEEPQE